jgi:hypothetical protein
MASVRIKQHDTAVQFTDTLEIDGSPVDLTNCTVRFLMKGRTAFSGFASVTSAAGGTVSYKPTSGFPTRPGSYQQEWEVTFPDLTKLTFPSIGYNAVTIIADLNGQ